MTEDLATVGAVIAQLGVGVMPTPADAAKAQAAFGRLATSLALPPPATPAQTIPPGTWFSAPVTAAAAFGGILIGGVAGFFAGKATSP